MRFFTPELYLRFNSPNRDEALRADAEWEEAVDRYERRLGEFKERLPSQVEQLADLCLHDAEILSRVEEIQSAGPFPFPEYPVPFPMTGWSVIAVISVKQEGEVLSIFYCLWDRMRVHPAPAEWPFSEQREHWLYDEVDLLSDRRGPFVHRILLSSGIVLEIPFLSVFIHRLQLPVAEGNGAAKRTA
jgi:hypothetical protein